MKKSTTKKVLISIFTVLLVITVGIGFVVNHYSSLVNRQDINKDLVTDTGKEAPKELDDIITIALFGTDYMGDIIGASDSTMILAIDKTNNKIKLCSLMRDMYLDLPDGGKQNLNYTMSDGGPELILRTMNYNFNLKIDKFVQVDLTKLPTVIDTLGGVEMTITSDEVGYINNYIAHIDAQNGTSTDKITSSGKQLLNGTQASAYCRIRYTEGRDFKRTERQRDVLSALFDKVKTVSITEVPGIVSDLLPLVTTNLSNGEIMSIASTVLGMTVNEIEQSRFPLDGHFTTEWTDMYHMNADIDATTEEIHKFLFSK